MRRVEDADHASPLLRRGRAVINEEAEALRGLAFRLDERFVSLAELILATRGLVVVSGFGKSWLVGARLSATLAATGTRSIMLHPTDALHGDLGRLQDGDLLLVISNSGETAEVLALIRAAQAAVPGLATAALTGNDRSAIACAVDVVVSVGNVREACSLGLAPTTSAIVMAALGDAMVVAVAASRGFDKHDFARLHPGGTLGQVVQATSGTMALSRFPSDHPNPK